MLYKYTYPFSLLPFLFQELLIIYRTTTKFESPCPNKYDIQMEWKRGESTKMITYSLSNMKSGLF